MQKMRIHALITGATRGIGRAVAKAFAEQGARIGIHYCREEQTARTLVDDLPGAGHRCFQSDLADHAQISALAEESISELGRIDVLVNNAGVFYKHPILETDFVTWESSWRHTIDVNLMAPAHLSFLLARHMVGKGGGKIINISSRGAFRGEPDAPAYGASKAGMNAMGQSMALALAPHGIYVYTVAPGWVETDMASPYLNGKDGQAVRNQSPLRRAARPEEIAATVRFLAFDDTQYLTGCIIDANGASYLRT